MSTSFARYVLDETMKKTVAETIERNAFLVVDTEFMDNVYFGIYGGLQKIYDTTKNPIKKWWAKKLMVEVIAAKKENLDIANT